MGFKKSKNKNKPPLLWRLLKRYLANSSIHGVRYLVDDERHLTERLFWLMICSLSWWGCATVIAGVVGDFINLRTVVTEDTNYLHWTAQLPSIHFCAVETPDGEKYINDVWKNKKWVKGLTSDRSLGYESGLPEPHGTEAFQGFVESNKLNCTELFESCEWDGKEIDCCEVFRPLTTPLGHCLSVNSIFTIDPSGKTENRARQKFESKQGGKNSFWARFKKSPYWKKGERNFNLYILGNTEIPAISTKPERKVMNKWKTSKIVTIDVVQQPTLNDEGVEDVPIEKRKCRFTHENEILQVYPVYGYDACVVEQRLSLMYNACGCISHLMPHGPSTPYCNQTGLKCISDSIPIIFEDTDHAACLADCEATLMDFFQNYSDETSNNGAHFNINLLPGPIKRYVRYVIHSKLDVVVAVGSALGLFVGASVLSLVEIPYWFLVRSIDDNDDDDNYADVHNDNLDEHSTDNRVKY